MKPQTKLAVSWLRVGYLLLAAIVMYLLVSQLSELKSSLGQLKTSRLGDDLVVLAGVLVTFLLATLTYYFITLKPIKYFRSLAVETGINTLNRLLPAGLGGIGANYVYLTKCRHTQAQAEAVVAVNTVIGIMANLVLLAILIVFFPVAKLRVGTISPKLILIACLFLLVGLLAVALIRPWRRWIAHSLRLIIKNLAKYRVLKLRLFYALLCQIGLTLAFVIALDFSLKAVAGQLPISSLMLAYSFAIWLGAVIPAPGGVGSVEAGLVGGLLLFKVSLAQAVAAVLIFRLITFWLPLLIGVVPLYWSYKKGYL